MGQWGTELGHALKTGFRKNSLQSPVNMQVRELWKDYPAVLPAVAHMFRGREKESLEIGTGDYNKKLDAKIADIKQQCNMQ